MRRVGIRRRATGAAAAAAIALLVTACADSAEGNGRPAARAASSASASGLTVPPTPAASITRVPSTPIPPVATPTPPVATPLTPIPPVATPIPPVATPVPTGNDILGPTGWQTLQLGMAPAVAEATGMFPSAPMPGGTGCVAWTAAGAAAFDTATISASLGVVAITVDSPDRVLMTPEGMALGWTAAQVHSAYPAWPAGAESGPGGPAAIPVPQNPGAVYRIRLSGGAVVSLSLEAFPAGCPA